MFGNWRTNFTPRWQWVAFCFVVVVSLLLLHSDGLRANFLADDYDWLRIAREDSSSNNAWLGTFNHSHGGNFYRPIVALGFQLDYAIGKYNPFGYHINQLIFQILLVLGVAILVKRYTHSQWLGFSVGLLFAVHPAQHEVVTWLAGRPDLYAALFSVWALVFFSLWLERKKWLWLVLSAIAAILGMLSKETAFVLPAFAALLVIPGLRQHTLTWKKAIIGVGIFVILLGGVLGIRSTVLTGAIGGYLVGGEQSGTNFSMANINRPFTSPFKLVNWDYALERYGSAGMVGFLAKVRDRLEQFWIVTGVVFIAVIGTLWWRRRNSASGKLLIAGFLWALIAFIPVYGLSGDIKSSLMGTRLLFFASIGYVAILVAIVGLLDFSSKAWMIIKNVIGVMIFILAVVLWRFNVMPWRVASDRVGIVRTAFAQQLPEIQATGTQAILFRRLPGLYFGAYEYYGPKSASEMVRSIVGGSVPAGYLVGSRAFLDSPFCSSPVPVATLKVLSWDASNKNFEVSNVPKETNNQEIIWDFRSELPEGWKTFGLNMDKAANGMQFTPIEHGQYLETPALNAFIGSGVRSLKVNFRLIGEGDFGRRRFRVDWSQNGKFNPGQYVRYSYDSADGIATITIPLCQFLPWSLSEGIDQLRILPATSGAFVLEQVILSPDAS